MDNLDLLDLEVVREAKMNLTFSLARIKPSKGKRLTVEERDT